MSRVCEPSRARRKGGDWRMSSPAPGRSIVVGSSISYIARVVAATDYLTFLPLSLLAKDGKGGIAALNVPGSTCSRSVQLLRLARVSPSPAVHAMAEELHALVGSRRGQPVKAPFGLPA